MLNARNFSFTPATHTLHLQLIRGEEHVAWLDITGVNVRTDLQLAGLEAETLTITVADIPRDVLARLLNVHR